MKIVILEDNTERRNAMRRFLAGRLSQDELCFFEDAPATIQYLAANLDDTLIIALDHDLELLPDKQAGLTDPGTGRDVADFLARRPPACPVVIHTTNSTAGTGMELVLQEANWETHRVYPYGDLEWIAESWFPAVRRAIIGFVRSSQ
jgi:hypothetical protein